MTPLEYLISEFPDGINGPWNMLLLSGNPGISTDLVLKYPDGISGPWVMSSLSQNPAIPPEFIMQNLDSFKWDSLGFSSNELVTPEFIRRHPEGILGSWCQRLLSNNPSTTPELVYDLPGAWNTYLMSTTSVYITPQFAAKYIDGYYDSAIYWSMNSLSFNPNLTIEFLRENPFGISKYCGPWSGVGISANTIMDLDIINRNPRGIIMPWDNYGISCNANVTEDFILENPYGVNGSWCGSGLVNNLNISIEFLSSMPRIFHKTLMEYFSRRKDITIDFILENPDGFLGYPWSISDICNNPNLGVDYILDHPTILGKKYDIDGLSNNTFMRRSGTKSSRN